MRPIAAHALSVATRLWFVALNAGQWIFVGHVIWSGGGSLVVRVHLLMAVIVVTAGSLQMVPQLRRRAPSFHRWNGRLYMLAVVAISITGLHIIWSRGRSELAEQLWVSLHALLSMSFAAVAVRQAIARDFSSHRRWVLRMWMVLNAGWFFRIGLTQRMFDRPLDGPFINPMSVTNYVLPLVVLELYLRAENLPESGRLAMAAALVVMTSFMITGLLAAATGM